jgi:PAS domain S-box-containing protein
MQSASEKIDLNFELLFEAVPGLFLVLKPDAPLFTILGASNAYLQATMTQRKKICGRGLFEVFPDNPDDLTATGTNNLGNSLLRVLKSKSADAMAIQKYDIPRPASEGGGFEERYWSPLNTPVLNKKKEIVYIIHRVEDVTEFIRMQNKGAEEISVARAEIKEQSIFIKTNQQRINALLDVLLKYASLDFSKQIVISNKGDELDALAKALNLLSKELQDHIKQVEGTNLQLESVIESYKDILIFSINKDYQYLIFNNAFKSATHHAYGTNVSAGNNMLDSITNLADREKVKHNCDKALAGEAHITLEVYGDLTHYYYETRYNPIRDDKGKIIGVTIMAANITDRKRAEEQLQELNKELESFSYSVSHDLRAPLRAVDGYAKMLEEDYGGRLDEEGNRLLEVIQYNAKKMGTLIDDLLSFSRLGKKELKKTNLNMNELVEAALYEISKSTKHLAQVTIKNLHPAKGDYGLINQVVINLLSNAIKYSSKVKNPIIEISSETANEKVIYTVKDNGAGFDMRYAHKLFEVFQRLHGTNEFEGTGVGLAIVQRIMAKHGGEVFAEGEVGKGATFKFSLPIN